MKADPLGTVLDLEPDLVGALERLAGRVGETDGKAASRRLSGRKGGGSPPRRR